MHANQLPDPGMPSLPRRSSPALHLWALVVLTSLVCAGCMSHIPRITSSSGSIPANRLPPEILNSSRSDLVPIDFTLLRQQPPKSHVIGPRDVLGVYVQGVVPSASDETPPPFSSTSTTRDAYPSTGLLQGPAVGLPLTVNDDGKLDLPLVKPVHLAGLTLDQATARIRQAYTVDRAILKPNRDYVIVRLIKSRVHRVLVVREDFPGSFSVQYARKDQYLQSRRGSAEVLDLPAFENDVLHALLATGGLPGQDAHNAVWIMRSRTARLSDMEAATAEIANGQDPRKLFDAAKLTRSYLRIPLRVAPGEELPFGPADVVLEDGDVVYLENRLREVFYTGGLLPGGQIPMPRDYDIDVIAAIAMANGYAGGPINGGQQNFHNGPGSIVAPTQALVVRTLPNGEQVKIRVELNRAVIDRHERIFIQPNDLIMLQYTPWEYAGNFLMNAVTFNVTFVPTNLAGVTPAN